MMTPTITTTEETSRPLQVRMEVLCAATFERRWVALDISTAKTTGRLNLHTREDKFGVDLTKEEAQELAVALLKWAETGDL